MTLDELKEELKTKAFMVCHNCGTQYLEDLGVMPDDWQCPNCESNNVDRALGGIIERMFDPKKFFEIEKPTKRVLIEVFDLLQKMQFHQPPIFYTNASCDKCKVVEHAMVKLRHVVNVFLCPKCFDEELAGDVSDENVKKIQDKWLHIYHERMKEEDQG